MNTVKNLLVLTEWSYKDALIQTYTLPYVHILLNILPKGSKIYLVTFEQEKSKMSKEERNKIIQSLREKNIILLDFKYHHFGIYAILKWSVTLFHLSYIALFKNINNIHAWCTTAGSLGYVLSLLTGKSLVLDSFEPHAEAMVENKTWSKKSLKFRLLFYLEKKQCKHARVIISATSTMNDYALKKYGFQIQTNYTKPACVDFNLFNISKRKNPELIKKLGIEGKVVCVYAGKFGDNYLLHETFDILFEAEKLWRENFVALILTSHSREELVHLANHSGFDPGKMISLFVPHNEIPDYIGLGDFALTTIKPIPSKRYSTPIKNGEYWAMGLPVIIPENISDDSAIIKENNIGSVLKSLNANSYREALIEIKSLLNDATLHEKIVQIGKKYRSFEIAEKVYKSVYAN